MPELRLSNRETLLNLAMTLRNHDFDRMAYEFRYIAEYADWKRIDELMEILDAIPAPEVR